MNSLSLLIYLSYITDRLSGFCIFLTIVSGIITIILIMAACILYFNTVHENNKPLTAEELATNRKAVPVFRRYAILSTLIFFISGIAQAVLPDRNTVLLIAASQIGEKIVNNEKVQSVVDPSIDLLKTWMVQQTQNLKKSMEPPPQQK